MSFFEAGKISFEEIDSVTGAVPDTGKGLGPRFNAESCGQCHSQPATGGSSPRINPQVAAARDHGATNDIPFFISKDGPVREARFPLTADLRHADGGVQDLFTISGRSDASGCSLHQPDFRAAASAGNLIFRIPTPTFGLGLIEAISDATIRSNAQRQLQAKRALGISGVPNYNGNDGTMSRFGWKGQNKSLEIFSGEAYNVEVGVTNPLFPNERETDPNCQFNTTPEDDVNYDQLGAAMPSDAGRFTAFMRFLDQPQTAPSTPSIERGRTVFDQIGCSLCHSPSLIAQSSIPALDNVRVNLFSDLLLHRMGPALADDIRQGSADGDQFRTAPLWGLGQRMFFLHDGRTGDLIKTIEAHASSASARYRESEANAVVGNYRKLSAHEQQDLLNFLRSL
jgi:CxxC motif-containing protein (DUF1111 family)